jgi:hypothetical protein
MGRLYAYRRAVAWSVEKSPLVFRESERVDAAFTQGGSVSIPHQSGHIHLITNQSGQYRFVVMLRPTICGRDVRYTDNIAIGLRHESDAGLDAHHLSAGQDDSHPIFERVEKGIRPMANIKAS